MFPGIPHKEMGKSYISSEEVLQYLHDFTDKYDLRRLCKVSQLQIRPGETVKGEARTDMTLEAVQGESRTYMAFRDCER